MTYVPTTVVVAVVVDGFSSENFGFSPPCVVIAGIGPVWETSFGNFSKVDYFVSKAIDVQKSQHRTFIILCPQLEKSVNVTGDI